jgi:hypothetical protein
VSSIDAVIAQARRPGVFTEKKRFSVAKTQAIQKLRKFALADPYAYILELVQSAVANGAIYIDIGLDAENMTLSYVGGGIPEHALSRLFDFLFAAKDRVDLGYVRELALGVNALMLFAPQRIVIESGDGTREGTTRVELLAGGDKFDVGRPDHALTGTFVRAEGMDRAKVMRELGRFGDPRMMYELPILETRCLAAPVPIMFNGESLFGYSTRRIPGLPGYERQIAIDEGDLYGALGVALTGRVEVALLTRGVLIENVPQELVENERIGGIICFDALRKTADHARIVRDDRWEELWLRLRPHAQRLIKRTATLNTEVREHGGEALGIDALRRLMREQPRVVVMPPEVKWTEVSRAQHIARALDAKLLVATAEGARMLRILGGESERIFEHDLKDMEDFAFFTRKPAEPPARPWLIQPVPAPPLPLTGLVDAIVGGGEDEESQNVRELLREALGEIGEVRATVYAAAAAEDALVVELRMIGRALGRVTLASSFAGLHVVAELPDLRPGRLRDIGLETLAEAIARHAAWALAEAGRRVLESMSEETCTPGGPAARQVLATAARAATLRLRGAGEVELALLEPGPPGVDLLGLPALATVDGRSVSLREMIAVASERCCGFVYGVVDGVEADLAGLDAGRIIKLDPASERHVIALVGEVAYVRVDARDVCAEHRGVVCRDFAVGLREYPEFPLLVEGTDPCRWSAQDQAACVEDLAGQLLAVVEGTSTRLIGLGAADAAELKRHALRHLQWLALRAPERAMGLLDRVAAGRSLDGRAIMAGPLLKMLGQGTRLQAFCWHGPFPDEGRAANEEPTAVELGPLVWSLMAPRGGLVSGFEFEIAADVAQDMVEETGSSGYLARAPVKLPGVEGWVAAPRVRPAAPAVLVFDADRGRVHVFTEQAQELGVVGVLRSTRATWGEEDAREVTAGLSAVAGEVMRALVGQVYAGEPAVLATLLEHAGRHLRLSAEPSGRVRATASGATAEYILEQPLFPGPRGLPRSGWRVVQAACEALGRGEAPEFGALPPVFSDWCTRWLAPGRVVRPAARRVARAPAREPGLRSHEVLRQTLEKWLHALRPDAEGIEWQDRGTVAVVVGDLAAGMGTEVAQISGDGRSWIAAVNGAHWLYHWAWTGGPRALAWLLLAIYGKINEEFEAGVGPEQEFQRRVAEALLTGDLHAGQ